MPWMVMLVDYGTSPPRLMSHGFTEMQPHPTINETGR
jgi:hypothetical protein